MLAVNVSANQLHPRLTFVPNLAFHLHTVCLLATCHSAGGGEGGDVVISQQGCQTADRSSSHTTGSI